ncbi:MAG: ferric reductase-like transmembrane domain-containing protein [Pseudomonadales bacterium]
MSRATSLSPFSRMLYALLAVPAAVMLYRLLSGSAGADELLHGSGEFSARLMIIALAATPLRSLWPSASWTAWLLRNRRTFGVMAFTYAALHTVFYIIDMQTLTDMLAELGALGIWTGWLALAVFIPLAATSNDFSVRRLGQRWRWLHRLIYFAALAVLVHWIYVHNNVTAAWLHFVPLILLEVFRVVKIIRS